MSEKLLVCGFEWVEDISKFLKHFIKSYNEDSDKGYFFEIDIKYFEQVHKFQNDLPFYLKE